MAYTFEAPVKDPSSELRHEMDWLSNWLGAGELIVGTPEVSVKPAGELLVDQVTANGGIVSWRVRGGKAGEKYIVSIRVTTDRPRIDERSLIYNVRNR